MIVKIFDTVEFKTKWLVDDTIFDEFWWSEGNGCCDCNRRLYYNRGTEDDDVDECTSDRYLIIDCIDEKYVDVRELVNDYSYKYSAIVKYNNDYGIEEHVKKLLTIKNRAEKIDEILK